MEQKIRNSSRWPIGKITKNGVFTRMVRGSRELYREPDRWGTDAVALAEAKQARARMVEIIDLETDLVYHVPMNAFRDRSLETMYFDNRAIVMMPLSRWKVTKRRR